MMRRMNSDTMMFTGNLPTEMADFFAGVFATQEMRDNNSKFPPYTKVRFKGTLQDMLPYVSKPDEAKAILFDGGQGVVLSCNDFDEGRFYTIDFGDVGYHTIAIPENMIERI